MAADFSEQEVLPLNLHTMKGKGAFESSVIETSTSMALLTEI